MFLRHNSLAFLVASPRGKRGLKFDNMGQAVHASLVASPRGKRGLKYDRKWRVNEPSYVASPRGKRGLKLRSALKWAVANRSLPPAGSVD